MAKKPKSSRTAGLPPPGFEWDRRKASYNERKHAVTFAEATSAFGDPHSLVRFDECHSVGNEERFVLIGMSARERLLVVLHEDRATGNIRIISARDATSSERRQYEEAEEEAG